MYLDHPFATDLLDPAVELPPSYHLLERLEAAVPHFLPWASLYLSGISVVPAFYDTDLYERGIFTGKTMSIPHFLVYRGHTDYALRSLSKPGTTSAALDSNLNLLLSWTCGRPWRPKREFTKKLLSLGFHSGHKVQLYQRRDLSVPYGTATVWIIFITRLWTHLYELSRYIGVYESRLFEIGLRHKLDTLTEFLENGADSDVVLCLYHRERGSNVYYTCYTSLAGALRLLRRKAPGFFQFTGTPWEGIMSGPDSTHALPSWALKIPGAESGAQVREDLTDDFTDYSTDWSTGYICSREGCIPAYLFARIY